MPDLDKAALGLALLFIAALAFACGFATTEPPTPTYAPGGGL